MRRIRPLRAASVILTSAVLAACRDTTGEADQNPVAMVTVAPPSLSLPVGEARPLQARAEDAEGREVTGKTVVWTTSNPAIVTVSSTGVITAKAIGSAQVAANIAGRSGLAAVVVVQRPVASVAVIPAMGEVIMAASIDLQAVTYDVSGGVLSGRPVAWATSNSNVATVNGSGRVSGVNVGSAIITATSEGRTGSATITVRPVPVATVTVSPSSPTVIVTRTVQLTATLRNASGGILTGRAVVWSSSNTSIATVTPAGLVTGRAVGTATITATSEGKSGSSQVRVVGL